MDVVKGSKELELCLVSEGSPQVGSEGGWGGGVCVEPLNGLGLCVKGSVMERTVEKVCVGLGAQGGVLFGSVGFEGAIIEEKRIG
jgi:hypothetical protein